MIYKSPNRVFGPLGTAGHRDLYQDGSGIGSFLGSVFRRFAPMAGRAAKRLVTSDIVKKGAKELLHTAGDTATRVAADIIEGNSPKESLNENLNVARKQIASSIRKASKRKLEVVDQGKPKSKQRKKPRKIKRKNVKYSVFGNE